MRRMYAGALILAILLAASLFNVAYLDGKVAELEAMVDEAAAKAEGGDFDAASRSLQRAIDTWNGMEGYTHIFIRHSEIDGATDAFYEYLSDLCAGDGGSARGSCQKLRAHLESIASMEHVTIGSIF
ncbi:MAG: DUF4363 family protein [Oscillospiraceae bacterium]